ncbi:MAG: recombinase family protein [Alphaproteobacteria bacterium]|nr:recombinase family protein [Alphaproteobacteria bacterium]
MTRQRLRCAIYTRKSTSEGLEQDFNSLDAQREACAAYILSQAGEGWERVKTTYDDGGFSGGSMERPGLRALMKDIEAGRVDVVVVYKVDRLTRSLSDFAKIVDIFDAAGASFVSVTQAFNTTTSMGRLTLNMLLSFAQFEREVTGERIRDKIAASKAKGMWMGGNPPLGYDIRERALHINESEAGIVRDIFQRFLALRSVMDVRDALAADGVRSKRWVSSTERVHGGVAFTHGALFHILKSRLYLGEVVHKDRVYAGQHAPIIDLDVFERVQSKLKAGAPVLPGKPVRGVGAPLLGKLFDDLGTPMTRAHGNKGSKRYHYYVSTAVAQRKRVGSQPRVSAPRLEAAIVDLLAPSLAHAWHPEAPVRDRVMSAIDRVVLALGRIEVFARAGAINLDAPTSSTMSVDETGIRIVADVDLSAPLNDRSVIDGERPTEIRVDRALVRAVVMAGVWTRRLGEHGAPSLQIFAEREGVSPIYAGQILPLAYLAPDLVEAILDGRQPRRLSLSSLIAHALPVDWAGQRALFATFA